jgi:N-carbamoylputrescine amidase
LRVPTLTIALLQLDRPGPDLETNLAAGLQACRQAKTIGADVALFPEMWSNGYRTKLEPGGAATVVYRHPDRWRTNPGPEPTPPPAEVWAGEAIDEDAPFLTRFRELAAQLDLAIAVTYLQRWDPAPRNSVSLIDRHGALVLTHAKVHTCAFDLPEATLTPGGSFEVGVLDTAAGPVRVGAMICYDREFPESARSLMLAGAELILVPNACDMEINRLAQLRGRAMENMVGIAMANYAGPDWGHSVAFDGMAFGASGSRDMLVVEAGEAPGVYPAPFDLDALRDYRRRETWGDAFRRPGTYGRLTERTVNDPFTRIGYGDSHPPR